ncbi:hypothetical protein LINPERHAP1_LOCUS16838 [Linum perenne]
MLCLICMILIVSKFLYCRIIRFLTLDVKLISMFHNDV